MTEAETAGLIKEGERATWLELEMIRNWTLIGRTLDRVSDALEREAVVRAAAHTEQMAAG